MTKRPMSRRIVSGALEAALLYGCTLSAAAATRFSDLHSKAWYYSSINTLADAGLISGYTDNTFRPGRKATVGESVKLILSVCGIAPGQQTEEHWASGYLTRAAENGWLTESLRSQPDLPMSRIDAAKLLVSILQLPLTEETSPFIDTADPAVLALYRAGIISGSYRDGILEFRPEDGISRAELCAILKPVYTRGKFQYGSHWVDIADNLPVNPYKPEHFQQENGVTRYIAGESTIGIDVSYYQKDIDWSQVKNSGIDFVMIRLGYRGYTSGKLVLDERFREYIRGASDAGLDIGIYFFSQAISVEEAEEEAQFVLNNLGEYAIEYPIVFDWEIIGVRPARTDGLSKEILTAAANRFCERISEAGYTPAIYFTKYLGYLSYELGALSSYDFWFAEYSQAPSFYYDFAMWQYSDNGKIPGISGPVDMNLCFKSY